jgi:hypothetical protein
LQHKNQSRQINYGLQSTANHKNISVKQDKLDFAAQKPIAPNKLRLAKYGKSQKHQRQARQIGFCSTKTNRAK